MRCSPYGIEPDDVDRSCGFLTKKERQYLLGEWEPDSDGYENTKRSEIRTRTRHAMADLALLHDNADTELKNRLLKTKHDNIDTFDPETLDHLRRGMSELVLDLMMKEEESEEEHQELYETMFEDMMNTAEAAVSGDEQKIAEGLFNMLANITEQGAVSNDEMWAAAKSKL